MRLKKIIFVDFDDVLVNSTKAFTSVYNRRYGDNVDWKTLTKWQLTEGCTMLGSKFEGDSQLEIREIYASAQFWRAVRPYPGALESLQELKRKGFTIILVSIGDPGNMAYKYSYAVKKFPGIFDEIYGIHHAKLPHSKTRINMRGCFMIDDDEEILKRTSASHKIHFIQTRQATIKYGFAKFDDWRPLKDHILEVYEQSKSNYEAKQKEA